METTNSSGGGTDVDSARWRIAYDTVSALVATHQSQYSHQQPISAPSHGATAARCGAASHSHRDNADMIHSQQQQQREPQLTQSSPMSLHRPVLHNSRGVQLVPPTSTLPAHTSELSESDTAMTSSSVAVCGLQPAAPRTRPDGGDDVVRLVGDGQALVYLFRRLLDAFYAETSLWMYTNVLLHPAARHTRNRLHWLGAMTGRGLEQAASNVLTGFITGYRQSRHALQTDVERTLMTTALLGRAGRLAGLAVELGVVLNPTLMMRSFSSVVKDLVYRTLSHLAAQQLASLTRPTPPAPATRLYRYESGGNSGHHHHHHHHEPATWYSSPQHVVSSTTTTTTRRHMHRHVSRRVHFPPPPPPYPGFLIHFLSVLLESTSTPSITDDFHITDNTSYEDLLRLGETIGEVKQRGLQLTDVQHLPSYHVPEYSDTPHNTSVQVCVICLDDFTARQMIRALPCCHEFHAKCIDRWLIINRTCPVCRYDVNPQSFQPMTSV